MSLPRRLLVAAALATVLLWPVTAWAGPAAAPTVAGARSTLSPGASVPGGFWVLDTAGTVTAAGQTPYGSSGAPRASAAPAAPAVGLATTIDDGGYWVARSDGSVTAFGDASVHPPAPPAHLNQPVVGMAAIPDGGGYWLVASDGGIFTFGDAAFFGSTGAIRLNRPIIGMASTGDGRGYWLFASDGGIFCFGDAHFFGSAGGYHLQHAAVGMAATPDGGGYWLATSAGQIFAFGDARRLGDALSGPALTKPAVGMAATADGGGYWLVTSAGQVLGFGDAALTPASGAPASTTTSTTAAGSSTGATGSLTHDQGATSATSGPVVNWEVPVTTLAVAIADPGPPPAAARAVQFALAQVGKPYVYGGTGPDGYDCSGLVMQAYAQAGLTLPRTAQAQYDDGPLLAPGASLVPGDIVFFGAPGAITHDGIYLGGGMMVDAPHTGALVRVESYQWTQYVGATRPAPLAPAA